ncbi:GlcG/HbpS family heme-binding protein [Anatilimnocola floriformis]|uniref:GlcG/HbpS family heme-binding protein n=1 Tax=Anatilimnocola floriformis TaxID=2948575 RepID=UPI0020C39DB1|nr:heme-binding protein [Anatilimnocola floriformis]
MQVSLSEAQQAIAAAISEAERIGTRMCIAILDSGANLKAFVRMEDAHLGCIDVATKKAKSACLFGMPSGEIGKLSQPSGPLFGIEHSNAGLITFPGGLPIVNRDGELIGAIGVSGSTVDNDLRVATVGAMAIGSTEVPEHPWRS